MLKHAIVAGCLVLLAAGTGWSASCGVTGCDLIASWLASCPRAPYVVEDDIAPTVVARSDAS